MSPQQFKLPAPYRDPIVARPGLPLPGPLGQAQDEPGTPTVRIRTLQQDMVSSNQRIRIVVNEPTLVKLTSLELDAASSTASFTAHWQALDDKSSGAAFYALIPFFGPYAWFEIPGVYEIRVLVITASTKRLLGYSIYNGLDARTVQMLLDPSRSHYWQSEQLILAAGVPQPIFSSPELFPVYKRIVVSSSSGGSSTINLNGSAMQLNLGSGGTTGQGGPGPGGLTIDADFLGRSTVSIVSTAGATVYVMVAQW